MCCVPVFHLFSIDDKYYAPFYRPSSAPHPRLYDHQPFWRSNLAGCDIVMDGIGEVDPRWAGAIIGGGALFHAFARRSEMLRLDFNFIFLLCAALCCFSKMIDISLCPRINSYDQTTAIASKECHDSASLHGCLVD